MVSQYHRDHSIPLRESLSLRTHLITYNLSTQWDSKALWLIRSLPSPEFNVGNIPALDGEVYIVTGSNTGIGKEVARLLYTKNAKVYIAARSETKAQNAVKDIKKSAPSSSGSLVFLHLNLNDLRNAKAAAESFLAQEQRLHGLFNNVGLRLKVLKFFIGSQTTFSYRNGWLVIGVEAKSYAVRPERILQIVAAAATVLVSTVSLAPNAVAASQTKEVHPLSNSKTILGKPPSIWNSDKRLAHLNLALSTRLEQCPLGVDGSPRSTSISSSQESGCFVESGSWSSHILGHILRDTAEFIGIIESYTPPRRDSSTGRVTISRLGTVVQLNLLSVHLQLIAMYDRLLKHFCGQLCADASASSSVTPSTQATPAYCLSPFDLPEMGVAGFQVQQGTLQTKILLETILHNLAMVERLMGLPMTWRVTDRQRGSHSTAGVFENNQTRLVLEAVGLSAIDWTDGAPDDHAYIHSILKRLETIKSAIGL
ncbi:putative short-chain dehydrogenase [Seiridium cupressi]